jgi:hypothetical protein
MNSIFYYKSLYTLYLLKRAHYFNTQNTYLCPMVFQLKVSFFLSFFIYNIALGQGTISHKSYSFHSPLNIPIHLSGNFGEPRSTHFHTGLDMRTKAQVGLPVFAIEDGYISRIGISSKGYGKVLYITHPQHGITSVYAHLLTMESSTEYYIKSIQYALRIFEIDTILPSNILTVKKGDIIAYSGNTGGSGGPHLHFEIRSAKTEEALNPMTYGFNTEDAIAPSVFGVKLYDLGDNRLYAINKSLALKKVNNEYTTNIYSTIVNSPTIGISVNAFDKSFNSVGRNGLYNIRMMHNGSLIFESKTDKIKFDDFRYSYAYADHDERITRGTIYHKCFVDPCNISTIYPHLQDRGNIHLEVDQLNVVELEIEDFYHNISKIKIQVKYDPAADFFKYKPIKNEELLSCKKEHKIENQECRVFIPKGALADDIPFEYFVKTSPSVYSNHHHIHSQIDPLLDSIRISINASKVPFELYDKAILAYYEGSVIKSAGGYFKKGWIETWYNKFGTYFIVIDDKAPVVLTTNIKQGKKFASNTFSFTAVDYLSGIAKYDAYIDDQWILMEYDAKAKHFFHKIEGEVEPGTHSFTFRLEDYKGNAKEYSYQFIK